MHPTIHLTSTIHKSNFLDIDPQRASMTDPDRACPTCEKPIRASDMFCPACGEATPTEMVRETGEVRAPRSPNASEEEYRRRLERALGGGFQLQGLLGHGGFGSVYKAHDSKLERDVAVKALRYDLFPTVTLIERFMREAQAVAKLRHANIILIYAVGEGEGLAYMIMPLVEGESLKDLLLREGRLAVDEARRILIQAADALDTAHANGIVHRDIKPENIMLDGKDRNVLLMDFGIAKALASKDVGLTGTGMIVGTPMYMSPEQASGEREIDHKSDLYSLGVVAFQMIAGKPPFTGSTPQALIVGHITEEPPLVIEFRPDCPNDLADTIARCLIKDPSQRIASAAELRRQLEGTSVTESPNISVATPEASNPIWKFRITLLVFLLVNAGFFALDLATNGALDYAPIVTAVLTIVVASQYSKLWMAGYSWRDVAGIDAAATPGTPFPRHTKGGDRHLRTPGNVALQSARAERAEIVRLLSRVPRIERRFVDAVLPAVDEMLAHMSSLVTRITHIDAESAERHKAIQSKTRGGTGASPDQQAISHLATERERTEGLMRNCLSEVQSLRAMLERTLKGGVSNAGDEIAAAIESLRKRYEK